jgi:hypothetical protein
MSHTPGPWEVDATGWPIIVNGPEDENGLDMVCFIEAADVNSDGYQSHTAEANARLIAAAPELLAALQQCIAWIDEGLLVRDISKDAAPTWAPKMMQFVIQLTAAKAAIAKATQS